MKKVLLFVLALITLSLVRQENAFAQQTDHKVMFGLRGGPNIWVSDFNKLKISFGGEFLLGYGLSKDFSLALSGGYENLKTNQTPQLTDLDYGYRLGAIKLKAIPVSLLGIVHLSPNSNFDPYLYTGVGAFYFKRTSASVVNFASGSTLPSGAYLPDSKYRASLMIPIGVGFEMFASKNFSIVVDVGARSIGNWIDFRRNKSIDGVLTAQAGFNLYLGKGDDDDDDNDGLSNGEERRYGTDPQNPDTDGDGLKDGEEVKRYRTNPLRSDTDGDGLRDGDEVLKYRTNPTKIDTDGDGLSDGDEVLHYKTDPLRDDTDGDGLLDGDEVNVYKTDPLRVDTDGDGLSDFDEVRNFKTDPHVADTDKDGLSDGEEVHRYHTDPLKADTDGGGVNDGDEVKRGTNPLDPADDQSGAVTPAPAPIKLEKGKNVVLEGVTFESGSAKLVKTSGATLLRVLQALEENPTLKVEIAGYTDSQGKVAANEKLSKNRAMTVKAWLTMHGIEASRLTAAGYGSKKPIASNLTPDGRARNRRIEFHVK
jgi:outer membrane protein OmpA-like peptidoglycan-associated protein